MLATVLAYNVTFRYPLSVTDFNGTTGYNDSADGTSEPCSHHGIHGLIYSYYRGLCVCPNSSVEYGDRCVEVSTDGELDGELAL